MKVLFLFFAVLNIVFFVWQADVFNLQSTGTPGKGAKMSQHSNAETLLLLSEAPDQQPKRVVDEKATEETEKPNLNKGESDTGEPSSVSLSENQGTENQGTAQNFICYALGPFEGLAQAEPISAKLKGLGVSTEERLITREIPTGYWVYLPQFDSWRLAKEKVLELEDKKIKDMFIMGRGTMKNAISLGLFKNQSGAQVRVDQVKELGENPKIQAQYTEVEKYWIDISVDEAQKQAIKTIEKIAQTLTILELNPRKCD